MSCQSRETFQVIRKILNLPHTIVELVISPQNCVEDIDPIKCNYCLSSCALGRGYRKFTLSIEIYLKVYETIKKIYNGDNLVVH